MDLIDALKGEYPGIEILTRPQIQSVALKYSLQKQFTDFMTNPHNKIKRGLYKVSVGAIDGDAVVYNTQESSVLKTTMKNVDKISTSSVENSNSLIPQIDKSFIKFGDYNLLKKIIKSNSFHPVYITGESGNGKTKMVYQACAENNRELIRANITETTDEDDLVGGFRLVNGETVWQDGPAVAAMKSGAVLLLDELNLASPKIMCLQPILEGNPIYIKKTNTTVFPQPGFTIIATANTKGKSSEDGRYIGSNTQNEALLDRFAITFEHEYPPVEVETQILEAILEANHVLTPENLTFVKNLVEWAKIIRDTYEVGGVEEIISTRRLIHIMNTKIITGMNRVKAIRYCISRFDEDTKKSFYSLYQKVDGSVQINSSGQIVESVENTN